MANGTLRSLARTCLAWLVASACAAGVAGAGPHDQTVPVVAPGAAPVACSNVAYDSARLAALGGEATDYWRANTLGGRARYVTEILSAPSDAITWSLAVPGDPTLYTQFAGATVPYAALLCYPTQAGNTAPDYALPTGGTVPRMQPAGQAPLFAEAGKPYPLVVYAHGLGNSPLETMHLAFITRFASHGYAVLALFHGDGRFAASDLQQLLSPTYLLSNLAKVVEQQAIRPLAVRAALDALLARPDYAGAIDATRIGGMGISLGGETMLLSLGGRLSVDLFGSARDVAADPRIKAAVGVVPYTGATAGILFSIPAFGTGQEGLAGVRKPFLAAAAAGDTVVPLAMTQLAVGKLGGTAGLVVMDGVGHQDWYPAGADDVATWSLTFLDAHVKADPQALETLMAMKAVSGGVSDTLQGAREVPFFAGSLAASGGSSALFQATLGIASADAGRDGAVYAAAQYRGQFFVHDGVSWLGWAGGPFPTHSRGALPSSLGLSLPVGLPCAQLAGVQFYVGYGLSEQDMLSNGKYGLVADGASCR